MEKSTFAAHSQSTSSSSAAFLDVQPPSSSRSVQFATQNHETSSVNTEISVSEFVTVALRLIAPRHSTKTTASGSNSNSANTTTATTTASTASSTASSGAATAATTAGSSFVAEVDPRAITLQSQGQSYQVEPDFLFDEATDDTVVYRSMMQRVVHEWLKNGRSACLCLWGMPASGKTKLCYALIRQLYDQVNATVKSSSVCMSCVEVVGRSARDLLSFEADGPVLPDVATGNITQHITTATLADFSSMDRLLKLLHSRRKVAAAPHAQRKSHSNLLARFNYNKANLCILDIASPGLAVGESKFVKAIHAVNQSAECVRTCLLQLCTALGRASRSESVDAIYIPWRDHPLTHIWQQMLETGSDPQRETMRLVSLCCLRRGPGCEASLRHILSENLHCLLKRSSHAPAATSRPSTTSSPSRSTKHQQQQQQQQYQHQHSRNGSTSSSSLASRVPNRQQDAPSSLLPPFPTGRLSFAAWAEATVKYEPSLSHYLDSRSSSSSSSAYSSSSTTAAAARYSSTS